MPPNVLNVYALIKSPAKDPLSNSALVLTTRALAPIGVGARRSLVLAVSRISRLAVSGRPVPGIVGILAVVGGIMIVPVILGSASLSAVVPSSAVVIIPCGVR